VTAGIASAMANATCRTHLREPSHCTR
jgi:hypothetical protein